jgi:hypothetical protein
MKVGTGSIQVDYGKSRNSGLPAFAKDKMNNLGVGLIRSEKI